MSTGDALWFIQMQDALDLLEDARRNLDANDETDLAGDVESSVCELRKRIERVRHERSKP